MPLTMLKDSLNAVENLSLRDRRRIEQDTTRMTSKTADVNEAQRASKNVSPSSRDSEGTACD